MRARLPWICLVLAGCLAEGDIEGPLAGEPEPTASPSASPSATPDPSPTPSPTPIDGCSDETVAVQPLFPRAANVTPIVERRADGVLLTRGAGRVRQRHELEGTYGTFGPLYFENRSYAFTVEDHVAAGRSEIVVTYRPEAPVSTLGPGTNFRAWKIYGNGNVFHHNGGMERLGPRHLETTVTRNAREGRELRAGDVLEFEFGVFIAGQDAADPDAIEGRTSYYTDTFRYRVGTGGLTAENVDPSGRLGPPEAGRSGGDATIPYVYAEPETYYAQMVLNMQAEHVQPFLRGRRLFHTDFSDGAHGEAGNPRFVAQAGKLGPLFNVSRCDSCHPNDGRGRHAPVGAPLESVVLKLYGHPTFGGQLQNQEGRAAITGYTSREVVLGDGARVTLERPVIAVPGQAMATSTRIARQFVGMGLLEAIDEGRVLARADAGDCDGDGISGRPMVVADPADGAPRLGRFGWRAEKVSLAHQVADALDADLGVSSPLLPDARGDHELSREDFDDLVAYVRLTAPPPRRDLDDPQVQRGEVVFAELGCAGCHMPSTETGRSHPLVELHGQTIRPYTDLLLHDLGPDLADDSGTAEAQEWRTPPLWGVGLLPEVSGELRLLHDGRARSFEEAILWHGGEAAAPRARFVALSGTDRAALVRFLGSL